MLILMQMYFGSVGVMKGREEENQRGNSESGLGKKRTSRAITKESTPSLT